MHCKTFWNVSSCQHRAPPPARWVHANADVEIKFFFSPKMICIDHMTRLSTTEHKNNNKKRRQNEKMHNCSVLWNKFTFGALLKRNQWLFNLEEHNDTNLDVKTQRTTPPPAPPPKSLKNSHAGIPTFSMAHQPDQNGKRRSSSICGSLLKRKIIK